MKLLILLAVWAFSFQSMAFDQSYPDWNYILKNYLKEKGPNTYFKYLDLKDNKEDLQRFEKVLDNFSKVTKKEYSSWNDDQKLAFLFNAYNAFTIKIINKNHSRKDKLESIKDIGSFFKNTWSIKFFTFLEEKSGLDRLEHSLARKNFDRPKLHMAFNCASISCPNLYKEAFVGERLEEQLTAAAKHFMNNKTKNYYKEGKLYVSSIFKWYGDDFDKSKKYKDVNDFVATYMDLEDEVKKQIREGKVDKKILDYNWKLNEL